jgi:hypothetical protein
LHVGGLGAGRNSGPACPRSCAAEVGSWRPPGWGGVGCTEPRHAFTTEDPEDRGENKEPAGKLRRPERIAATPPPGFRGPASFSIGRGARPSSR